MAHLTPSFATHIPATNDSNKLIKSYAFNYTFFLFRTLFENVNLCSWGHLTMVVFPKNNNATFNYCLLKPIAYINKNEPAGQTAQFKIYLTNY